jgi:O-antigen ligase
MKVDLDLRDSKQVISIANIVVASGVFFFMTQTLDAFNYPKVLVVSTGTFALLIALTLSRGYLLKFRELHWIEYYLLGMSLLTVILASFHNTFSFLTLWGSFSRSNGLMAKVPLFLIAAVYFRFSKRETTSRFFEFALLILIVEVIYGAIQLTGNDPVPWNNPYNNIFVTAGNPNFAAALFAILVVLNVRNVFYSRNYVLRIFVGCALVLGIYMSYATQSVQGILTIAAAAFLLCVIGIFRYFKAGYLRYSLLGLSAVIATPVALGVFNFGPLKSFLFQETLSIRLHYWRVALNILADYPFAGVGIDRYGDFYRLYREQWFVEKYGPGLISTNAHNVALQWGTDLGVLGIVMYLSLLIVATIVYLKSAKFRTEKRFLDLDFVFVSFLAFYLQSLISISQLSVTVLGFAIFGIVLSFAREDSIGTELKNSELKKNRKILDNRKASFIGIGTWWLIFALLLVPFTSSIVRKDLELRRAIQLPGIQQQVSDLAPRSEAIQKAVQPFLEDQDYVSLTIQNLYTQGNAQTGVEIAKEATVVNPRSWVGYQSQVLAYAQSNIPADALRAAIKTLALDPLNYNIQFNLAEQALKTGDKELARKYATRAKESAPSTSEAFIGAEKILSQIGR